MPLRLLLALLGGLGVWSAFPGIDAWPAATIGVALLTLACAGAHPGAGFVLGFAFGMAYLTPLLGWSGTYLGSLPWLALSILESLYLGALGAVCAWLQPSGARSRPNSRRSPVPRPEPAAGALGVREPLARLRIRPLAVTAAWVVQEFARSHTPFGGFPWGRLAFSQADAPFARLAAIVGAPGVSAAVALTGALLAGAALAVLNRGSPRVVSGWLLAAGVLAGGPLLLRPATGGPTARVLAIQGNVPQAGLDFNAQRRAVLDNHVQLTEVAAASRAASGVPRPDVVVWPENASDIDPYRNADADAAIRAAVASIGAPVLVGAVLQEPADHATNASLLYRPGVGITDRYDKRHPAPFAEYIPFRSFFRFFSRQVDLVRVDFVGGREVGVIRVPRAGGGELAMGVNICFEVAGDDLVADGVRAGANIIVVQTNNATFGYTEESAQQLAISRIRAIEHGRSVVHISNVGQSALITPDGRTGDVTALFTARTLTAELPLREALTPATRLGQWPPWVATVVLAGLAAARGWGRAAGSKARRGRAARRPEPTPAAK